MHHDDERPARSRPGTDRQFLALVETLCRTDPRFARRYATPGPGQPSAGALAVIVGVVATVLLGLVPLAIGLQVAAPFLLGTGALMSVLAPVTVPLAVQALLARVRPLWV